MQSQINSAKRAARVLLICALPLGLLLAACGGGETTTTTTPAAQALTGTIVVDVSGDHSPAAEQGLRIARLDSKGQAVNTLETAEHTIHVAPGTFEVILLGTPPEKGLAGAGQVVTVAANQEVKVAISLHPKGHASARHHH